MAIKWTKQDVIKKVHEALNPQGTQGRTLPNVLQQWLAKSRAKGSKA